MYACSSLTWLSALTLYLTTSVAIAESPNGTWQPLSNIPLVSEAEGQVENPSPPNLNIDHWDRGVLFEPVGATVAAKAVFPDWSNLAKGDAAVWPDKAITPAFTPAQSPKIISTSDFLDSYLSDLLATSNPNLGASVGPSSGESGSGN